MNMPEITESQLFEGNQVVYPYKERVPYVISYFFSDYTQGEVVYVMNQREPINRLYPSSTARSQGSLLETNSLEGTGGLYEKELWIW